MHYDSIIIREAFYTANMTFMEWIDSLMSIKYEQDVPNSKRPCKIYVCQTCKNMGFILGTDEINYTEKMFIEECPECNS
jgi:hypothetical protein